jgi:hypothetical protein
VHRDGGNKRYEFEAESAKLASAFHHPLTYRIPDRLLMNACQTRLCKLSRVSSLRWSAPAVSLANHGGASM